MVDKRRVNEILEANDMDNCFEAARKDGISIGYHESLNRLNVAGIYQSNNDESYFVINKLLSNDDQEEVCFMLLARHTSHQRIDYVITLDSYFDAKRSMSLFAKSKKLFMFAHISGVLRKIMA